MTQKLFAVVCGLVLLVAAQKDSLDENCGISLDSCPARNATSRFPIEDREWLPADPTHAHLDSTFCNIPVLPAEDWKHHRRLGLIEGPYILRNVTNNSDFAAITRREELLRLFLAFCLPHPRSLWHDRDCAVVSQHALLRQEENDAPGVCVDGSHSSHNGGQCKNIILSFWKQ